MELARRTIDAHTDAGPDEDGIHTMGAAVMAADYRMFAGVNLYHFTPAAPAPNSWLWEPHEPRAPVRCAASLPSETTGGGSSARAGA
ncbi:hypothetical protein ACFSNO_09925 [Streptomyces cirratus]